MNPVLLVVLIVGGLVLLDVLMRFARPSPGGRLASAADAIEQFRGEYPDTGPFDPSQVILTADRRAAFIPLGSGATGFVYGFGDRFVVRQLRPADVGGVRQDSDKALRMRFNEVTLRPMRLEFEDAATRDLVLQLLGTTSAPI